VCHRELQQRGVRAAGIERILAHRVEPAGDAEAEHPRLRPPQPDPPRFATLQFLRVILTCDFQFRRRLRGSRARRWHSAPATFSRKQPRPAPWGWWTVSAPWSIARGSPAARWLTGR